MRRNSRCPRSSAWYWYWYQVVLNIQYCDPLLAGFACLPPTVPSFHARKHCVVTYGSTGACQRGFVVVGRVMHGYPIHRLPVPVPETADHGAGGSD
jgi:hypothetical protein